MEKLKKNQPLIFLILIIIVGLAISIAGIYLISQQKKVKELNLKKELTELVKNAQLSIMERVKLHLERIFDSILELVPLSEDSYQSVIDGIKGKAGEYQFIKYPFLVDSSGKLLFPINGKPVMPLREEADEITLYRQIKLDNIYFLERGEERFNNQIFINHIIQDLYRKALKSEFKDKNFKQAAIYFKKAILQVKNNNDLPLLYNGLARCNVKNGQYKSAIKVYLMILTRFKHVLRGDLEYLEIRLLRQVAKTAIIINDQPKAGGFFLRLLDRILAREKYLPEDAFIFFKYEALDFLENLAVKNSRRIIFDKLNDLKEAIKNFSKGMLDAQLKKLLMKLNESDQNERSNVLEDQMDMAYVKYHNRLLFYATINNLYKWSHQKDLALVVIDYEDDKDTCCLCFKNLSRDPLKKAVCFGFLFDQSVYEKGSLLQVINDDLIQKDMKIRFIDQIRDSQFNHPVLSIPFEGFFCNNPLVLYSNMDDYLDRRIRQEIWINYSLMAVLILTFIFFIFLFYKYISREAELLNLKSNFVDSVSHTLKTPLTRISLLAENVASDWVEDEAKKKEFLQTIVSESSKMNDMINNMLNFSKIDAGKKHYDFKLESLAKIIQSVMDNYSEYIRKLGFTLEISINTKIPDFMMDREGMKLVIINLLQNAIKYSFKIRQIKIQLYQKDQEIILVVADKGIGMMKGELKKIFDKYYRTKNKQVKALEGSGLGLFLVKEVTDAHQGTIKVTSQVGEGSTFTISFPLRDRNEK